MADRDITLFSFSAFLAKKPKEMPCIVLPQEFAPFRCCNCGERHENRKKLYCDGACQQLAATVRVSRRWLAEGRLLEPSIVEAIFVRLIHVDPGGYNKAERRIPAELRLRLMQTAGG